MSIQPLDDSGYYYRGPLRDPGSSYPYYYDFGGGGGAGNMATGEVVMNNVPNTVGPLVASVDPVSGDIIIGHSNVTPANTATPVTTANPNAQSSLMPLLIIGVVALLLFKK